MIGRACFPSLSILLTATACIGDLPNSSSEPISDKSLTRTKWCQTSSAIVNAGATAGRHQITIHHRLTFNPAGSVIWQDWGKDGVIDEKNMRRYDCRQNSSVTLICQNEDVTQIQYQVSGAVLILDGQLVNGVTQFSPCTEDDNAGFDQP